MQNFTISSSWLESLNIDYKKIQKNEGTISLSSTGQIKIPTNIDSKDKPFLARIETSFKSEDEKEVYLNFVYVCEIVKNNNEQLDEEELKEQLNELIENEVYSRVNEYLDNFYRISNIQFVSLPLAQ